jgi:hypothetical protein
LFSLYFLQNNNDLYLDKIAAVGYSGDSK